MLKDTFGFSEHQEKAAFGLGYRLTLTRKNDDSVSNKRMQPTLVKVKLILLNGMYPIKHQVFHNKLFYLNNS